MPCSTVSSLAINTRSCAYFTVWTIEVTRRRGRRRKQLLDDLGDRRGYSHLKKEALDRSKWRNRFGRGCGPVVWQITDDDDDWLWTCRLTDYWWWWWLAVDLSSGRLLMKWITTDLVNSYILYPGSRNTFTTRPHSTKNMVFTAPTNNKMPDTIWTSTVESYEKKKKNWNGIDYTTR
jgi:hypothetical protein